MAGRERRPSEGNHLNNLWPECPEFLRARRGAINFVYMLSAKHRSNGKVEI